MFRVKLMLFLMLFSFTTAVDLELSVTSKEEAKEVEVHLKLRDDGGSKSLSVKEDGELSAVVPSVTSDIPTVLNLTNLPLEVIDTSVGFFCGKKEVEALRATSKALNKAFTPMYIAIKSVRRHYTRIMAGLFFDELKSAKDLDIILYPIRGLSPGRLLSHLEVENMFDRKELASKLSSFAEKAPTVGLEDLDDVKDDSSVMVQYKDLSPNKQKLSDAIKAMPNIRLQVVVEVLSNKEDAGSILWDNDCLPVGLKHLELVHVGSRAKKFPDNALSSIRRLESLILPDSVEHIGFSVCALCTELKSFKAKGLQLLGEFAVEGADLKKISCDHFVLVDGEIVEKKK